MLYTTILTNVSSHKRHVGRGAGGGQSREAVGKTPGYHVAAKPGCRRSHMLCNCGARMPSPIGPRMHPG